jgi:hypothetical protein
MAGGSSVCSLTTVQCGTTTNSRHTYESTKHPELGFRAWLAHGAAEIEMALV